MLSLRASGAPARRGEYIRPHVEHRQQVITPVGIRRGNNQRLFDEIQPRNRVQSEYRVSKLGRTTTFSEAVGCPGLLLNVFGGPNNGSFPAGRLVICLRVRPIVTSE